MKIAIVQGWEGIIQQKRRWSLEHEIKRMQESIANTERNLQARRTTLAKLIEARDAIPNRETVVRE